MNSVVNQLGERAILVFLYTTRPGQDRQAKVVPPKLWPGDTASPIARRHRPQPRSEAANLNLGALLDYPSANRIFSA